MKSDYIAYKIYLLDYISQDLDSKIDNGRSLSFEEFVKSSQKKEHEQKYTNRMFYSGLRRFYYEKVPS